MQFGVSNRVAKMLSLTTVTTDEQALKRCFSIDTLTTVHDIVFSSRPIYPKQFFFNERGLWGFFFIIISKLK